MREKCLHLLTLFSSFFFLVFFFALGKAANRTTQSDEKDDDAKKKTFVLSFCRFLLSALCLVSFVGRRLCWCRKERERERGNARRHHSFFPNEHQKRFERDDAVVFSVGLRRRPGTRGAVGRREAPRTKAARRFGGNNNNNNNNNTLAGWSVDQRRALPTRKEDTNDDGVKIRRGDFAPVAAGGGVFLR